MATPLNFKPITLQDRDILTPYFDKMDWKDCNGSFASLFLWSKQYPVEYALVDDMAVVRYPHPTIDSFYLPIGDGSGGRTRSVLERMLAFVGQRGTPLRLHLTSEDLEGVRDLLPHLDAIEWKRELADYIYPAEKLRTLSGKSFTARKTISTGSWRKTNGSMNPLTGRISPNVCRCWLFGNSKTAMEMKKISAWNRKPTPSGGR